MDLLQKIDRIMFEQNMNLSEFLEKTGFSKGLYYSIKNGDKNTLKPDQAKAINKVWNTYSYGWLMGNESLESDQETLLRLAEKGVLGVELNKSYNKLIEIDQTFEMFFDKAVHAAALKLISESISKRD